MVGLARMHNDWLGTVTARRDIDGFVFVQHVYPRFSARRPWPKAGILLLSMNRRQLWKCPKCGRPFANRNQSHFCSQYKLRDHLCGKTPLAVALFRDFARLVRRCGPVRIIPEKTRIAFSS